jgi:hypothetical protein
MAGRSGIESTKEPHVTTGTAEHTRRVVAGFKKLSRAERIEIVRRAGVKFKLIDSRTKPRRSSRKKR